MVIIVLNKCLHSFRIENKLKSHENVFKSYDYCYIEMPEKHKNILKYSHGEKSMKVPSVIYADTESLLEKIYTCYITIQNSHPE